MKVLFLDIDGVLNHDNTEERVALGGFTGFLGIDRELLDRFQSWISAKDYMTVLSSSWRQHDDLKDHILEKGIFFSSETPRLGFRGAEIERWISSDIVPVETYAILDDINQFYDYQQKHLVLTDPRVGVTRNDLDRIDKILNG